MTKRKYRNLFYDGFNSKLIETAHFESILEIPKLEPHASIEIPSGAVPFSKRKYQTDTNQMMVFYEMDPEFREFVSIPQLFDDEISGFRYMSTPDCSLYRDMPLIFQLANIAVARSVGYYHQKNGKYVIPNVRWGTKEHTLKHYSIFLRHLWAYRNMISYLLDHTDAVKVRRIGTI